ncbi:LamG-like jellyroll fold domain-containing protein [Winogradskyella sp. Asnod2-B02-A]|uniref:LamG-like jellyroll fold domain-containing protein n=1 Tax=Winogradskyella sp. Asnod2-B02-A TaxID=3160583 RepID=UPI003863E892
MKNTFTKLVISALTLILSNSFYGQNSGFIHSYVILDNGSGNTSLDLHYPSEANDDLLITDFTNATLGTIGTTAGTLLLNGGQNTVWKCASTDYITSGWLYYTVYPTGNRPAIPSFSSINLGTNISYSPGTICGVSSQDEEWITDTENINLLNGLASGNHTLEVYTSADYTINSVAALNPHYVNNNGTNFTTTFTADTPPSANCFGTLTVELDATGNATITASDIDNGSFDDFDTPTLSIDINTFDCSDIGTPVTVTLTAEDSLGQNSTCITVVTVADSINPVIAVAPENITVECTTDVPAMINLTWTDNCDAGGTITGVDSALVGGTCAGTITRSWNITDSHGNSANTRTQIITIDDTIAPVIETAPANITVNCISDVPSMTNLAWTDNCDASGTITGVDTASAGIITRTWNIADNCGNNAITRTQIITVDDTIIPIIDPAPPNITVQCTTGVPAMINLDWTDNCDAGGTVTGSDTSLPNGTCGTITRTWNITDANGNSAVTRTQIITVQDIIPPTASNPLPINVECITTVPLPNVNVVTDEADNCATPTVTFISDVSNGMFNPEIITRTYSVTDGCNNSINVTQTITIKDITPPSAICRNFSVTLNASGNASITASDINNSSSDNCSTISLSASRTNFDCSHIGANNVTLTATDASNNITTCTAVVTVVDLADNASVSITVDNNTICAGKDVTFTATPVDGGTSPIYDWFVNGISQGTTGSPTFTSSTTLSDNDEVYVQMHSDLSTCISPKQSNSIIINVNPLPVISGPTSLCNGNTTNLSPATTGWVSNTSFASVNNSGVVTATSAGIATFTYTDSNGCSSGLSITINNATTVSAPSSICVSESSNLSSNSGGTWVSNNVNIATVTSSGIITGVAAGFVTFTFTNNNGCTSTTNQVEILVKPIITTVSASNDQVCSGVSSILTASVQGAGTNNKVIVNYNFNTGTNYGDLDGQNVPGIVSEVSHRNLYFRQSPGTATQGSAYDAESFGGNAMRQRDNSGRNDEGFWIFTVNGPNITTYQDFSLYFQTRRATTTGDDKYVYVFYNVVGNVTSGSAISFRQVDRVLLNNTAAGLQWQEVVLSIPALANNTNVLQIIIATTDGYEGNDTSLNPDIIIDNVQIRASSAPDSFTYSWAGNTGSNAGLPVGSEVPSSTNSSITVNPQETTVYTITAHNSNGCTESEDVTITVNPSPIISIAAEYCPDDDPLTTNIDESNMVQLVASSTTPVSSWEWQTTPVQTGDTIYVDTADFYQVIGTSPNGCTESGTIRVAQERIFNGDFSDLAPNVNGDFGPDVNDNLNALGFDYDEDYSSPFTNGYQYVVNPVLNQNMMTLTTDSGPLNTNFRSVNDHTDDTEAQFLAVNSGNTSLAAWRQEIDVEPNELYYFSAWGIDLSDLSNPSLNPCDLQFRINGIPVGPTLDLVKGNNWERIYGTWNSGITTTAIIEIININPATQGNNFGIDDVSFATLSTFITLTSAIDTDDQTICQNTPILDITYDVGGGLTVPTVAPLPAGLTTSFDGLKLTISGTPTQFGTFNYTITTTSNCGNKSEYGSITVDEAPLISIQPVASPICSAVGNIAVSATISGSASSGTWSTSGNGTFSPSPTDTSATYNFGLNEVGTTTLTFTSNAPTSSCIAAVDSINIEITESIVANAGADIDNSAANCSNTTVTLAANNVTGQWTVISSQPANTYHFSNSSAYNTTFTGESGETYTLQWEATNLAPCNNTTDTVNIIFADCGTNLVFDGAEDYINFGNNYGLVNTPFSIEAWIKVDNLTGTKTIISKRNSSNLNSGYDLSLIGNKIHFRWNNQNIIVNQPLNTTKWYHIAVTFNGSDAYNIYVDGFLVQPNVSGTSPLTNTNSSFIGAMDTTNGNPTNYFDGDIDEVRIWDTELSTNQIREMMNQEIESNGLNVRGLEVPLNITENLQWNNLIGYYQMRVGSQTIVSNGYLEDISTMSPTQGKLNNMTTDQTETAPIPYISDSNSVWDNGATWSVGSVQQIPNSRVNSHNGFEQTWNIVRTKTNISATRPANILNKTTVLGLLVDSNKLSILNDQQIIVNKYLKIDGVLDLVGESQLLQPEESNVDYSGSGYLERDQQGTANLFNYNYWSSPVGDNGNTFSIANVMFDGTTATNPQPLNWTSNNNANPLTSPITISRRWLYLYENYLDNSYADWNAINENYNIPIGLGYSMKGSGSSNANQNYTFVGQPNNGTITSPVSGNFQALVGNPYPSAIDAVAFINDNSSVLLDGTLYFWEHAASNNSHNLSAYEGGYAARNLTHGVPAVSSPEINGQGDSNKIPGRYVPVAQGFFVTGNGTGGMVTFNNSQRVFAKESDLNSFFLRSSNTSSEASNNPQNEDNNQFIRLDFITPDNATRQLVIGFMDNTNATDGVDYGYDGLNTDSFPNDMSFNIDGEKFIIQGVGPFDETKSYPLDIDVANGGNIEIVLNSLENFNDNRAVYIYDALEQNYISINNQNFQIHLEPGNHSNRFYLVFQEDETLSTINNEFENVNVKFLLDTDEIYIKTPSSVQIKQLYLINVAGQSIASWNATNLQMSNIIKIPIKNISEGAYIIKAETETGTFNKKIIIKY